MLASKPDLIAVLRQYNPWWGGGRFPDLPDWRRAAFREITASAKAPPGGRALLLSGARQVGKTTLFLQAIDDLLSQGVQPINSYPWIDMPPEQACFCSNPLDTAWSNRIAELQNRTLLQAFKNIHSPQSV